MAGSFEDHFSEVAAAYAAHRPTYPPRLYEVLAEAAPARDDAWDCATGSGQAAVGLASRFARVVATDASEEQIRHAVPHPRVTYRVARAEAPGLPDHSVDLVTVAQAAHWLDLDAFFDAARRAARPGAVIAIWSYGLARVLPAVDEIVRHYHDVTVGSYWSHRRRFVDDAYRDLPFPFPGIEVEPIAMEHEWSLEAYLAYLGTWSAARAYARETGRDPLKLIREDVATAWGRGSRLVIWPLALRVGRIDQ
jgi:SAM-dependent methyltransferase